MGSFSYSFLQLFYFHFNSPTFSGSLQISLSKRKKRSRAVLIRLDYFSAQILIYTSPNVYTGNFKEPSLAKEMGLLIVLYCAVVSIFLETFLLPF